ncbi:MAG: hypothetical protein KatS3mg061_2137 [Dehalococcoidia bacterium]|nr:MAG: hypothetical protein KatS3mg061_2137 [Dehalococcoidia bacterium]
MVFIAWQETTDWLGSPLHPTTNAFAEERLAVVGRHRETTDVKRG